MKIWTLILTEKFSKKIKIAEFFPNFTDSELKNRYYVAEKEKMKKLIEKM